MHKWESQYVVYTQIRMREGEDVLLLDNSNAAMWKIRNARGQEVMVPALIVLIPGPDKAAVDAAVKWVTTETWIMIYMYSFKKKIKIKERRWWSQFLEHSKADVCITNMARASIRGRQSVCLNQNKMVSAPVGGLFRPGELVITSVLREELKTCGPGVP